MAGRPKNTISNTNNIKEKRRCTDCKKEQVVSNFYVSKNPLFGGRTPLCKKCIAKIIDINNIETVYEVLRSIDAPFDYETWKIATESNSDTFGTYMRMCNSLPQLVARSWNDSIFEPEKINNDTNNKNISIDINDNDLDLEFKITRDMILRWGDKYSKIDYMKLEEFYIKMKEVNKIETPQDEFYLKKLAVISLKLDQELENGNYSQAKQLGDLFSKYMADSKFRAMDKTEADKTGGIRNFGTIYAEVESDGFIPPWEYYRKLKGIKQDIVDKTIMHIENFTLKLNKIEKMSSPPIDVPKLEDDEMDFGGGSNGIV